MRNSHFVKVYKKTGRLAAEKLTDNEWNAITKLMLWVRPGDNLIRRAGGAPMTQEDIALILRKSMRFTKDILARLERREIIRSRREGRFKVYEINETFACEGRDSLRIESLLSDNGQRGPV